jgi:hypothetical protein
MIEGLEANANLLLSHFIRTSAAASNRLIAD